MSMRVMARRQGLGTRVTSLMLTALLLAGFPGANLAWATEPGAAAATGGLSLVSDPPGAIVYVDGKARGTTPMDLSALPAGDHRVKVVKEGYLENSRVVRLAGGRTENVQLKLTRNASASTAIQVEEDKQDEGGGGGKKKLLIGAAVAAVAAGAVLYVVTRNDPPVPGTIGVNPSGQGMQGLTNYNFTSQGSSDPNGDSLTYNWNFGDGSTGSGATTSHVYGNTGAFNVSLSVSDGKETVNAPGISVTVARNMTGTWSGASPPGFPGTTVTANLTANGTNLSGSNTFAGNVSGTVSGLVGSFTPSAYPTTVTFTSGTFTIGGLAGTFVMRFNGTTDAGGTSMTGTLTITQTAGSVVTQSVQTTFRR